MEDVVKQTVTQQVFEHSIQIQASATAVETCLTDLTLMHRWLNPALRCEPVGDWSTAVGSRSRFRIQTPLIQPTLNSVVSEREPGLIVWKFQGFFKGRDRWECQPTPTGTLLSNRFEFEIPNPLVRIGFETFAADWTKHDMQTQLRRLKRVAEEIYQQQR
ncbi:MAG: SRPBCC family protein [Elainellaceae cyanobacterium]